MVDQKQQRQGGGNRHGNRPQKKKEFNEKVLEVRRVTRVMAGGKRFSFRATVVVGDGRGKVGIGLAKGLDVAAAVEKAKKQAQKNFVHVPLIDNRTIAHAVEAKYCAAQVRIKPAALGHGFIAGGSCRVVLDLVGVKDISAKIIGRTKNKLANAMATLEALKKLPAVKFEKPFVTVAQMEEETKEE